MSDYIGASGRTLTIPASASVFGVYNDQDIAVKHFRIPRHYKDLDLSDFDIRINFRSVTGGLGSSMAENVSSDEEYVMFDWTVPDMVFEKAGPVQFVICCRQFNDDDEVVREWNTAIGYGTVLPGIEPR